MAMYEPMRPVKWDFGIVRTAWSKTEKAKKFQSKIYFLTFLHGKILNARKNC